MIYAYNQTLKRPCSKLLSLVDRPLTPSPLLSLQLDALPLPLRNALPLLDRDPSDIGTITKATDKVHLGHDQPRPRALVDHVSGEPVLGILVLLGEAGGELQRGNGVRLDGLEVADEREAREVGGGVGDRVGGRGLFVSCVVLRARDVGDVRGEAREEGDALRGCVRRDPVHRQCNVRTGSHVSERCRNLDLQDCRVALVLAVGDIVHQPNRQAAQIRRSLSSIDSILLRLGEDRRQRRKLGQSQHSSSHDGGLIAARDAMLGASVQGRADEGLRCSSEASDNVDELHDGGR